jgi:hypothetical protein
MKKLIEIQAELKAPKNQRNAFGKYNYRSCEDILEAVKPLLKASGLMLTITDEIREVGGLVFVESIARIDDGKDSVEVRAQAGINPDRKGMDIAQSFGSSSSYARKYALNGLFLIDDTKDADATNDHGKAQQAPTPLAKPIAAKPTEKKVIVFGTPQFDQVVEWIQGEGTIELAKKHYSISEEVEDAIKKVLQVKEMG